MRRIPGAGCLVRLAGAVAVFSRDIPTTPGYESRTLYSGSPPESEQAPLTRYPCYIVLLLGAVEPLRAVAQLVHSVISASTPVQREVCPVRDRLTTCGSLLVRAVSA